MGLSMYLIVLLLSGLVLLVVGTKKSRKKLKVIGIICVLIPLLFLGLFISPLNQV